MWEFGWFGNWSVCWFARNRLLPVEFLLELVVADDRESKSGIELWMTFSAVVLVLGSSGCCQGDKSLLLAKYKVISVTARVTKLRHMKMALKTQMKNGI